MVVGALRRRVGVVCMELYMGHVVVAGGLYHENRLGHDLVCPNRHCKLPGSPGKNNILSHDSISFAG